LLSFCSKSMNTYSLSRKEKTLSEEIPGLSY
jgi:hypothetical protein